MTHRFPISLIDRLRSRGAHGRFGGRLRIVVIVTAMILVLVLLIGLLAVRDLARARTASEQARAMANQTVQQTIDGDTSGARLSLDAALEDLDLARSSLDTVWISLVGVFPPVSQEVEAVTAGIETARFMALAGRDVLEFANAERPPILSNGHLDAEVLGLLGEALDRARTNTDTARSTLRSAPASRAASVRDKLAELNDASATLEDVLNGASALVERLENALTGGEPFRVLILFENGAELRATGGLIGFVAELDIDRGPLRLINVGTFQALRQPGASTVGVEAPDDYMARYGVYLANTPLWSNVNLSPHFPTVAGVAGALYEQVTGSEPELVVRLDLTGVGRILSALPPQAQADLPFEPSKLATDFIVDSYLRYSDTGEQNVYLAGVVDELFAKLLADPTVDGATTVSALVDSARERHLAVFSADPNIEGALAAMGTDGALQPGDPGQVEVVVQNFGANKLDLFTETDHQVALDENACTMTGAISTTLTNAAGPEAAQFPSQLESTDGLWWVNVYLPTDAVVLAILKDGQATPASVQSEQGRPVVATLVNIPAGQSVTVTVRWKEILTEPTYQLALQPQPLVNPATLTVSGFPTQPFTRNVSFEIPTECSPDPVG